MRITLALVAYNQAPFVEAAARSALAQVCEPIEVILSDDCSTDDTLARLHAVAAEYAGPHRVLVRSSARNRCLGGHINDIVGAASGRLIVWQAGDDISLPHRVAKTAQAWDASGERLDLIAAHVVDMRLDGVDDRVVPVDVLQRWKGPGDWAERRPYIIGAAHATTRRLFERFGPLPDDLVYEDQVNVMRALCAGGAWTVEEPLVRYRRGGTSSGWSATDEFRLYETRRHARHRAVLDQWLRDAATAGCVPLVHAAVEWERRREAYVADLLAARTLRGQLGVLSMHRAVSLRYRLDRLTCLRAPRLAIAVKRLKRYASASGRGGHAEHRSAAVPRA